jgi:hypothetical protein
MKNEMKAFVKFVPIRAISGKKKKNSRPQQHGIRVCPSLSVEIFLVEIHPFRLYGCLIHLYRKANPLKELKVLSDKNVISYI